MPTIRLTLKTRTIAVMTPSRSHSDLTPVCGNNMFNISQGVRHRSMVDGIAGRRDLTKRQLRHMLGCAMTA
jgi:hypothetical protein